MHYKCDSFAPKEPFDCLPFPKTQERASLYPTLCRLKPQARSQRHAHYEAEFFYIVAGQGEIYLDQQQVMVTSGDMIAAKPFSSHEIINNGSADLIFLSIYSEDYCLSLLPTAIHLTAAPPTPNGPLHLGHLSGPYLVNDVLSRYLRLRQVSVLQYCGTDDHQNYLVHPSGDAFRISMRSRIEKAMQQFSIHWDEWLEPKTDHQYQAKARDFFNRAAAQGIIEEEEVAFPFCETCSLYLYDAHIQGLCPFCLAASQGTCEACGMVVPPSALRKTSCRQCNKPHSFKQTSVFTFDLSRHLPAILTDLAKLTLSSRQTALLKQVSALADAKIWVTYPDANAIGIQHPTNHILNVWFEMASYYEAFALSDITWAHCFGFDNTFHYLFFMGSLLNALEKKAKLPDYIICNEFLLWDEAKFSTSRQHAIWADEIYEDTEYLRFFLCLYRAQENEMNFSWQVFHDFYKTFKTQIQQLVSRAQQRFNKSVSKKTLIQCNRLTRDMEAHLSLENVSLRQAARLILNVVDDCSHKPAADEDGLWLHWLGQHLAPFMPEISRQLLNELSIVTPWINDWGQYYVAV